MLPSCWPRLLGAEQYGLHSLAISAATIFTAIASLGLDTTLVRYVARLASKQDASGLWGVLQIGIGLAAITSLLISVGLFILAEPIAEVVFQEPKLLPLLQLLCLIIPFMTLSDVLAGATRGFKKMHYTVIARDMAQPVFRVMLIGILALIGIDAFLALITFGVTNFIAAALLFYFLNKEFFLRRPLRSARRDFRETLTFALSLWLSDLLKKFRKNIQALLLGVFSTVVNVGILTLINRINLLGRVAYTSTVASAKPIISELYAQNDLAQMGRLYQSTSRWVFMLNLPGVLVILLLPEAILSLFGQSFVIGAAPLTIMAWSSLITVSTGLSGSIIDMTGYNKLKLINSVINVALAIGSNLLLIPRWGVLGAAVATLISVTAINVLRVLEVWFLFHILPYNKSFLKPLGAGLATVAVANLFDRWIPADVSALNAIAQVIVILVSYAGMNLLLGLDPVDRAVVVSLYQRAKTLFSRCRTVLSTRPMVRPG